jgi:hypothetical protein
MGSSAPNAPGHSSQPPMNRTRTLLLLMLLYAAASLALSP